MRGGETAGADTRAVIYCLVPRELAPKLHEPLRRHFRSEPDLEVVVERRAAERRAAPERRASAEPEVPPEERRRIRSSAGRRMGERRAQAIAVAAPPLPRTARRYAAQLVFVERLEPSGLHAEDLDTGRLVARIQGGDDDAFADLYTRYFDRVYSYLRLLLRDSHDAEDATQQVFVKVLVSLPRYERRRQPFRAWLFTVVKNHAITQLERQNRTEPADPGELSARRDRSMASSPEDEGLQALDWINDQDLMLFVERLPLAQRQVLLLRYMLDLSDVQIGAILGRSREDVRALQHRALTFLRARLAAVGRTAGNRKRVRMRSCPNQAFVLRSRRFSLIA